jgi:hypothetical protein
LTTALSSLPPGFFDYSPRGTPVVLLAWLAVLAMFSFLMAVKLASQRKQYAYAGLAFFLMAAAALAGCSGTSSNSSGGGSSRTVSAKYSGDSNYAGSTGSTTITVH